MTDKERIQEIDDKNKKRTTVNNTDSTDGCKCNNGHRVAQISSKELRKNPLPMSDNDHRHLMAGFEDEWTSNHQWAHHMRIAKPTGGKGGRRINRKPDHCGRCGKKGRRRSWEVMRDKGVYACRECMNHTNGLATILKYRTERENIDIISDFPTIAKLGVDLLDILFQMSSMDEESSNVLVGNLGRFGQMARYNGIACREVDFLEDRREALVQEIDSLSGENLSLILYSGKYILPTVRRLIKRSNHPVIVLADGDAAVDWKNEGVLTISESELPKQRRRGSSGAASAAAPAQ